MKTLIQFAICLLLTSPCWAQMQAQTLGVESLNNSKVFIVGNLDQPNGIQVKVKSHFKGEPAIFPFSVKTFIKCKKNEPYKVMDIAKVIIQKYPAEFSRHLGAPTQAFPNGVVQVCALENVNFDSQKIFLTVFEPGSNHCDRSRVMDLMFAIDEFCER